MGSVILLENEDHIIKSFRNAFEDHGIKCELISCNTPEKYDEEVEKNKKNSELKAIIFDLFNKEEEEFSKEYKAKEYISNEYANNRIPIFIHSGFLEYYDGLNDKGTVFKVAKSKSSVSDICSKLKKFEESGFLDIFCHGGIIETKIMSEIHKAFTQQFKNHEINDIIESLKVSDSKKYYERTTEVFERISVRNLLHNLKSGKYNKGMIQETKLNSIEHYYHRLSDFEFWTGDIIKIYNNSICIILTPRCNVGHNNFDELLLCKVEEIKQDKLKELTGRKGEKNLKKNITDNEIVGDKFRFLPPTPQFSGGLVNFKTVFTQKVENLDDNWERIITLSDELTNDVVRKFANYNLRGGISETEFAEAHHYVKYLIDENKI